MTARSLTTLLMLLVATLCHAAGEGSRAPRVIEGFDTATARRIIVEYADTGLEGLWRASEDGATVAIIAADAPVAAAVADLPAGVSLLLVMVDSPAPAISPGTVIGWAKPAAKPGKWDARISTGDITRGTPAMKPFTLTLADDSHLTLSSARTGLKVRPRLAIPYLGRWGITERREREADLDGFIRVWPPSATTPPPFPVYL